MDGVLRGFINKVAINPNMVKVLVEVRSVLSVSTAGRDQRRIRGDAAQVRRAAGLRVARRRKRADFCHFEGKEELHVTTSEVKAVKEVRNDLNILKSQCGNRVREHLLAILRKITPESNLEEIQKSELLPNSEIMLFLKKHIPKTFEEVAMPCVWDVDQAAVRGTGQGHHDESHQVLSRDVLSRRRASRVGCSRTRKPWGAPKTRWW